MVAPRLDDPLTADQLRTLLDYDPATGIFIWKWRDDVTLQENARHAGHVAGSTQDSYTRIDIHARHYAAHRLAWLYVHGRWPKEQIDHINRNRTDNRIANLREATHGQNSVNRPWRGSSSGIIGVRATRPPGRWEAQINYEGTRIYLGRFATTDAARRAYEEARTRLRG
jgi:hypothetical protein